MIAKLTTVSTLEYSFYPLKGALPPGLFDLVAVRGG